MTGSFYCKKIPALLSLFILVLVQLRAQENPANVLNVSGDYGKAGAYLMDWSVGNLISETYTVSSTYQLSQGFLQPDYSAILVTLDFAQLPGKTYGDVSFELYAVASNGSEIEYSSSNRDVAIIVNGNLVEIVGAGTTDITATIKGTTISVTHKLVVDKATQTITFEIIPTLIAKGNSYTVDATASSGLPVNINSSDVFTIRVDGKILEPLDIGKVLITLSQDGNQNYYPVAVTQWVQVTDVDGGKIKVPTLVTPNGDGINDVLQIVGIENYPDNRLIVVNRNGTKIFDIQGYDNGQALFNGRPQAGQPFEGKAFFKEEYLPQGTYFYVLHFRDSETGERGKKTGFFVLKY